MTERARVDGLTISTVTDQDRAMVAAAADMTVEQLVMSFPFLCWSDYLAGPSALEIPGMRAAWSRSGSVRPRP